MKIGTVTGTVHPGKAAASLAGQIFLVVNTTEGEIVAADYAGAKLSDRVLLVTGKTASRFCMEAPVDAAVVAVLEQQGR